MTFEQIRELAAAKGDSDTYNDENSVRYMHEPECRSAVASAQKNFGLGWEVACEYAKFRDKGHPPDQAAFDALIEWDL